MLWRYSVYGTWTTETHPERNAAATVATVIEYGEINCINCIGISLFRPQRRTKAQSVGVAEVCPLSSLP